MPMRRRPQWLAWLLLALVLIGVALIRVRLLEVPLDRDEGEYAYMARLLLAGTPPYAEAYNMKFPGIYVAYALVLRWLGPTTAAIRVGVLVVTTATGLLVFVLGSRLGGPWVGAIAGAAFAILSVSPGFLGIAGYAEHFLLLPAIAGLIFLLVGRETGRLSIYVVAGALLGCAIVIKQHGLFFLLFAAVYLLLVRDVRAIAGLGLGAAAPAALTVVWLGLAGVLPRFWFWTVSYASAYASIRSPLDGLNVLFPVLAVALPSSLIALGLAGLGLVALVLADASPARRFLLLLLPASLLATTVGFYFRQQYFLLAVPVLALLIGTGVVWLVRRLRPLVGPRAAVAGAGAVLALALGYGLWADRAVLFRLAPNAVARAIYHGNPFPESVVIARYLQARTAPTDRIAVIGSEPQIYFYADRRAATGYIYTYALMESQPYAARMQEEMIREIEAAAPAFVVYVNIPTSWLATPDSPRGLWLWFERYRRAQLEQVGVVDMLSPQMTLVYWDDRARDYTPKSPLWITIYRRRPA